MSRLRQGGTLTLRQRSRLSRTHAGFGALAILTIVSGLLIFGHTGSTLQAQDFANPAQALFESRCARCHGSDGNGGEMGPPLPIRLANLDDPALARTSRQGRPTKGMPPTPLPLADHTRLIRLLRGLQRQAAEHPVVRMTLQTTDGATLQGRLLGQRFDDLQLQTDDKKVHLLRRVGENGFRRVTSDTNWDTYNGDPGGNRYSKLTQINTETVRRLAPRWSFTLPEAGLLQ